ncbi:MAG: cell surface protein SprA [Bacteroidota bacterium]
MHSFPNRTRPIHRSKAYLLLIPIFVVGILVLVAFSPTQISGKILGTSSSDALLSLFTSANDDTTDGKAGSEGRPGLDDGKGREGLNESLLADSLFTDSTLAQGDTTALRDTAYVVFLDSTARLAHFTHVRKDRPQVSLFGEYTSPLFAKPRGGSYKREITIDTTASDVLIRELMGGKDIKQAISLPLSQYIAERRKYELRKLIADEARKSAALVQRDDLGELLGDFTKFQIPIPQNPIFSIFGKPEINLSISGAVDIKAGFRNTSSDQTQLSVLDQDRNEPDFSQEVQVNVNGTIGDKLNILADWNTQRTFEYENQLKIKYTGYDDEIVRSVEAGNVSLQTPSSFIGSSQALFGVKAEFQAGPLRLTALASQKKGQIKEVEVSGGAQKVPFEVRAWNYSTNNFFVDTSYIQYYEPYYRSDPPTVNPNVQIVEEEVWVQRQGGIPDPNERPAILYVDLTPRDTGYTDAIRDSTPTTGDLGKVEIGRFVRLQRNQYELLGDGYIGVIGLNTSVQDQYAVGISYRRSDGTQFGEFSRNYGTDTSRTVVLKMVKPKNLMSNGPGFQVAWRQLLKNIYSIGGRNLKESGFTLDILREVPSGEVLKIIQNEPLLRVMGLDRYNIDGTPSATGDNVFDFRPRITVSLTRAEIIFPTLEPFDEGITRYFDALGTPLEDTSYTYPEIYDTTKTFSQQNQQRNKYVIKGEATGDATSKYSLGFNVVEGSVQVLLEGRALTPNIDFTVDYIIGEVVIRNDRALVPGANLQIKYEQNDLFQLASKTLLGARGDVSISQNASFGFTIMNLNQQTLSDKVRLGEEPNNNTIFGMDGTTTFNLPFLTQAIDAVPLLQTREASSIRLTGEAAYMLPDPNTKKSPIPSDGGEGIAYIDDFEGSRRTIPVGINYSQWTLSGPPADTASLAGYGLQDTVITNSKGKMILFNRLPTDVALTDVFPRKRPGNAANDQITVMDLRYFPLQRGQFNYSPDLGTTLTPAKNWGGVMKSLSIAATNLVNENINFIELWMRVDRIPAAQPDFKMVIEMGAISENVIPLPSPKGIDRTLHDEDYTISNNPNGTLQEGEDIGLDMLSNAEEIARYSSIPGISAADPSGDDYSFSNSNVGTVQEDYSFINGTENNKNSPAGLIPDTEDLNANGIVDLANSYFRYELPLNTDTLLFDNPYIVGGGNKGWYQFRIPIRDWTGQVGSPSFENIEFVRVLFANAADTVAVRIADFSLVGNQWQEIRKDSTFAVSVIGLEENPAYTSPPGVIQERDKTRPDEEVYANEQSLALLLTGVPDGESRQAIKYYSYRPLDLFNYKTMKMFVHGDPGFQYRGPNDYDAEYFFRFGADTLNFYEYRAPIHPDWDSRNEMVINFPDLTAIKQTRDSTTIISEPIPVEGGPPGAVYRVLGNPSLTQVRFLVIGVTNRPDRLRPGNPLIGDVWINELRLTTVDDTPGWAYRFDTQLKLADLGSVSFNYSKVDPNFHTLEQRFGSRQTGVNWGLGASVQLEKFFPTDWVGTSLPFSYTHTEGIIRPKYLPNSDVLVTEAAELTRARLLDNGASESEAQDAANQITSESESFRVSDTYAAPTLRLGLPSQEWFIRDTFNKLSFGINYTKSTERSPAVARGLSWQWTARIAYAFTFSPDYFVSPFSSLFDGLGFLDDYKDMKIFFTPTSFSWSFSAARSRNVSLQRAIGSRETITRNFTASRQLGFGWKLTEGGLLNLSGDYSLGVESSLLAFETDRLGNQRRFSQIIDDIFFGDKFINFGEDTRYSQRNQFNTRPNIPNILNIKKYLDVSFGYGVDYSWANQLLRGDLGKSAGFNNNINFSTNFRLKALIDPLFNDGPTTVAPPPRGRRGASDPKDQPPTADSTTQAPDSASAGGGMGKAFDQIKNIMKVLIKVPFLDYDNINVTFTQTNSAQNSGVVGRTGFVNFWGRVPFFQDSEPRHGPSRLYQLGLISDPSGRLTNFGSRSHFPFFGWDVEPGVRATGGVLVNSYRQTNRLAFKTTRSLWEGAKLDLNWNIGWAYNRSQNLSTDSVGANAGMPIITNTTVTGSVERSFFTLPDVLFFGIFKSNLKEVSKKYTELRNSRDTSLTDDEKLARAFEEGFEALPLFRTGFGQFYPRVNWSLRWDGLEKLPLFSGFVTRLSLDHSYSSTYTRQFRNLPGGGGEQTDAQRVAYGFAPLMGLNFTFKDLFKGSLGATMRYNTNTSFDLQTSSRNIVETLAQEISITASYNRRGFEIPLFGLALNNDLDVSFSYSITKNSRKQYEIALLEANTEGTPLEGTTRTVMEPRIKYILSSRVTASIYYRYTKIAPDDSGSRIPGSTTNEAGLDIHISIQ